MSEFPIFLINLDDSSERLAAATAALAEQGAAFTRIPAHDGRGKDPKDNPAYDPEGAMRYIGRPLNGGEVGCFLSQIKALQAFIETGAPYGLVLEDDMQPNTDALALTKSLIDWQMARGAPDWFVANLGQKRIKITSPVAELQTGRATAQVLRAHYFPMRATAMLWTQEGAAEFLRSYQPIQAPLDVQIRRWLSDRDMGLAVDPLFFTTTGAESDIDKSHLAKKRGTQGRIRFYRLHKALRILADKLRAMKHKRRFARISRKDVT